VAKRELRSALPTRAAQRDGNHECPTFAFSIIRRHANRDFLLIKENISMITKE
jgi:hypothetical protein